MEMMRRGEYVRVLSIGSFPDPKLLEAIGLLGQFHGVWIDQEHSAISHQRLEQLLIACRACGLDAFARVAPTDYATLMRPMETGCSGVMIAQVRTVAEAEQAVQWVKYPPRGVRGLFTANAETRYGLIPVAKQVQVANDARWLAVQIETAEAVACVQQLANVNGVDMLFVGPADLSSSLGVAGEPMHPKCQAALRAVSDAARQAGIPWGALSRDSEHANFCRSLGCQLFSVMSDMDMIQRGISETQRVFHELFG